MSGNLGSPQGLGLVTLDNDETTLLRMLDSAFERWSGKVDATSMTMPPLLPVASLAKFDYYENFPHQAMFAVHLDLGEKRPSLGSAVNEVAPDVLSPVALALPSAACYGVYLNYEGATVADGKAVTVMGRCFRREERYAGLRRLLGFHMREIVRFGSKETTDQHLEDFSECVLGFAKVVGLNMDVVPATDPFYDRASPKALLQKLTPVKHEFVVDGLAIASVNVHRNFFGERCDIRLESGEYACTSCVAFGLERWISVLTDRHGGLERAIDAVAAGDFDC